MKYDLTIFIITYNRAQYLRESIQSILNQTYKEFELIILDNFSIDNTKDIVKSFNDSRIKYIKHKNNIGGIENINYAFDICRTKYFIIFHDDDVMNSNLVEKEIKVIKENKEYAAVSCLCSYINNRGEVVNINFKNNNRKNNIFSKDKYLISYLKNERGIICPSVLYRKEYFEHNKLRFMNNIGPAADQYLWFEVGLNNGIIYRINQNLMSYRIHDEQDSIKNLYNMDIILLKNIYTKFINKSNNFKIKYYYEIKLIILSLYITISYYNRKIDKNTFEERIDNCAVISKISIVKFILKYVISTRILEKPLLKKVYEKYKYYNKKKYERI